MTRLGSIEVDLSRLNSATKYPSIPTYHTIGGKGRLAEPAIQFTGTVHITEKVDGTNARILSLPDGQFLIGSREELLYYSGDSLHNPSMGIVDCIRNTFPRLVDLVESNSERISVLYGEVYGHKIGKAASNYTAAGTVGFRLFDWATIELNILDERPEHIAAWRDGGGQGFKSVDDIAEAAKMLAERSASPVDWTALVVPWLAEFDGSEIPTGLEEMAQFVDHWSATVAQLDDVGRRGESEGIVLRASDRSVIAKARREDYRRTLHRKA